VDFPVEKGGTTADIVGGWSSYKIEVKWYIIIKRRG